MSSLGIAITDCPPLDTEGVNSKSIVSSNSPISTVPSLIISKAWTKLGS